MKNKEKELLISYLEKGIESIFIAYSPLSAKEVEKKYKKYFKDVYKLFDDFEIEGVLDLMVKNEIIEKRDNLYSIVPFEILEIEKLEEASYKKIPEKKFKDGDELLRMTNLSHCESIEEVKELRKYLEGLDIKENKEEFIDDLLDSIIASYFSSATEEMISQLPEKTDLDYVNTLVEAIISQMPVCSLRGNSCVEVASILFKDSHDLEELIKEKIRSEFIDNNPHLDNSIKEYPPKKNYDDFSYEDCIKLAKKFDLTKLCRMVDSDRFLELTINGEKRYVSVLGFHNKDYGIIVYPTYDDVKRMYPFILTDGNKDYPDIAYHFDAIEICLSDPNGIASDDVRVELKKKDLPLFPSFIRLKTNYERRLVNQEEINIVGGVLSDLLRMMANTDFSEIVNHLGDKDNKYEDINQVYVLEDETLFGAYFDSSLGDFYLNFEVNKLNKKRTKELMSLKNKHDLLIGLFIPPFHVNGYYPYMFVIKDAQTGLVINMDVVEEKDLGNIANKLVDRMLQSGICPSSIGTNNEYCYKAFFELSNYLNPDDYYIDESGEVNELYEVISNIPDIDDDLFS